ncbi:MAG: tRNA isopentenyl-2-thiomethyl-A-37 hydroxylase MiaE [Elusimicrobiota bacterium]
MRKKALTESLPLKYKTPEDWGRAVFTDPFALLSDHAYLERKAASNALDLLNRWPEPNYPKNWAATLSNIVRDEAMHLNAVLKLLLKRGGTLARLHRSPYASDLRTLVRRGLGPKEILDRLLVSALIEARSCERFEILSQMCPDKELAKFYGSLYKSERGHFAVFLDLGKNIASEKELKERWEEMLEEEAKIIQQQPTGPYLHSKFSHLET